MKRGAAVSPGQTEASVRFDRVVFGYDPARPILRGLDLNGKEIIMEGSDLLARAFCHEMDHLDGRFFLDHLSFIKRDMIKRRIKKLIRQGKWE